MTQYHKIQTVFKRDPETNFKTLLDGQYSFPEFEYLKDNEWIFTEKVDGTNIRIYWDGQDVTIKGRTDRAEIPKFLLEVLEEMFDQESMAESFGFPICLYGEGYGPKIHNGGKYRSSPSFVLFDAYCGGLWLRRDSLEEIAESYGMSCVPVRGSGTLADMVDMARNGIKSMWLGDFQAEGLVARPQNELLTRRGDRIITKIKCKDFPK